jgi:hypothetical protein
MEWNPDMLLIHHLASSPRNKSVWSS